jgi:hypothetical protein
VSDEATQAEGDDAVREANEREQDLDAETIFEDAEELFSKKSDEPPLQPDDPPPES